MYKTRCYVSKFLRIKVHILTAYIGLIATYVDCHLSRVKFLENSRNVVCVKGDPLLTMTHLDATFLVAKRN